MNKLMKKIEDIMVAVTFAEAGEYDEANRQSGNSLAGTEETSRPLEMLKKTAWESAGK